MHHNVLPGCWLAVTASKATSPGRGQPSQAPWSALLPRYISAAGRQIRLAHTPPGCTSASSAGAPPTCRRRCRAQGFFKRGFYPRWLPDEAPVRRRPAAP